MNIREAITIYILYKLFLIYGLTLVYIYIYIVLLTIIVKQR